MEVRRPSVSHVKETVRKVSTKGAALVDPGRIRDGKVSTSSSAGTGSRKNTDSRVSSVNSDELLNSELAASCDGCPSSEYMPREMCVGRDLGLNTGGGVDPNVALASGDVPQTVAELSRRRLANDPAMMRELKRYRKLMLLTLLPSITSEADQSLTHPHAHVHSHTHSPLQNGEGSPGLRGQPDGMDDPFPSEHLPRPEPTDGVTGGGQGQGARSAGMHRGSNSVPHTLGPASAGTRLPLALRNPLDTSPQPAPRRRSHEDASPRPKNRRRSQGDVRRELREDEGDEEQRGVNNGELDLLTLAALYLESRHRVLGKEWHSRPDVPNKRSVNSTPPCQKSLQYSQVVRKYFVLYSLKNERINH